MTATPENTAQVAAGDFTGLFEMCNVFIPGMQKAGGGSIINIRCPEESNLFPGI